MNTIRLAHPHFGHGPVSEYFARVAEAIAAFAGLVRAAGQLADRAENHEHLGIEDLRRSGLI